MLHECTQNEHINCRLHARGVHVTLNPNRVINTFCAEAVAGLGLCLGLEWRMDEVGQPGGKDTSPLRTLTSNSSYHDYTPAILESVHPVNFYTPFRHSQSVIPPRSHPWPVSITLCDVLHGNVICIRVSDTLSPTNLICISKYFIASVVLKNTHKV